MGLAGGLSFALWNDDVREFIINSARYYIQEFHVDGFRYDEISALLSMNQDSGWSFCCDLTNTLRYVKPRLLQNAEYWPFEFQNYPRPSPLIVTPTGSGGTGFDVLQHDGLRSAVRGAVGQASQGQSATVDFDSIAGNLYPQGFAHGWQAVTCVENHDLVQAGREPRIPALADGLSQRSWYARSRSRFATGLLLTAPGIPQLFMGQEFLQSYQWSPDPTDSLHLIWWNGLNIGGDQAMVNHLRFTQDLIRLRWNQPALRGDNVNPFHVHDQNRVIAFHRWLEGTGNDVIVVATLAETTWYNYAIGFPYSGPWAEVFNSDVYDNWVNPIVAGNGGGIVASGRPAARLRGVRKYRDPSEWNGSLRSQCVRLALTALSQAAILDFAIQSRKRNLLPSIRVEIRRIQPALECRFSFRPFRVEHGEPRRVTISAFNDHVLAKDSLECEAQTQCCAARRRIERVTFPFVAAVSEIFENVPSHQIHRLGRAHGPLQTRGKKDAANLNHSMRRLDAHIRSETAHPTASPEDFSTMAKNRGSSERALSLR